MRSARSGLRLAMMLAVPLTVMGAAASAEPVALVADLAGSQAGIQAADVVAASPSQSLVGARTLSDDELSDMRGGFMTAGGVSFDFGVVVRSYVNDQLALQTQLTWTPTGPVTQLMHHDVPGVIDLAGAMAELLAGGIDLTGLSTLGGLAVVDADGATAVLHNITTRQLQSLIVNNADNRNIRQDMELNLVLPDLATIQTNSRFQAHGAQIGHDMDWAALRGLGR